MYIVTETADLSEQYEKCHRDVLE